MDIYIPYNYKYFHQKYKMSYDSMWNKYKQLKRKEYDWYVVANNCYDYIYAKGTYDELLFFIDNIHKDKKWFIVEIENLNITNKDYYTIPRFHKIYYDENMESKGINHHYHNKDHEIGVISDNEKFLHSIQYVENGRTLYMRADFINCIEFKYIKDNKAYYVKYDSKNNEWETVHPILFSDWERRKTNKDDQDAIIKILKKMSNKQYKNFYKYDIDYICKLLSINI
jgi:hypothetical protein